jgi:Bacterial Ig domain
MKSSLLVVAVPLALLPANSALAVDMCVVAANQAIMGANITAAFDVQAGQGCMYDIRPQGRLNRAKLSQRPRHGTVKMVDKDTWTYQAAKEYHGADSFAITAQGQTVDEKPGTSVLSFTVNVK